MAMRPYSTLTVTPSRIRTDIGVFLRTPRVHRGDIDVAGTVENQVTNKFGRMCYVDDKFEWSSPRYTIVVDVRQARFTISDDRKKILP